MVYFISNGSGVKIGFSDNVDRRISEFQTGNDFELVLFGLMKGDMVLEKKAHSYFKEKKILGEWYDITQKEICLFFIWNDFDISNILTKIKVANFTLIDYVLWDIIYLNKGSEFTMPYSKFENMFSERAFYKSKKKLLQLNMIKNIEASKKYTISGAYI